LSDVHKRTLEELTAAIDKRNLLRTQGADTMAADAEVRRLRREMRRGLPLRVGDTLEGSRYILREELVAGETIRVWLAHDSLRDVLVVVKVLTGEPRRDRFTHAAACTARLHHDAIVPIFAAVQEDLGHHFLVMGYVRGSSLSRAVKEGRVGSVQCLAIIRRIGEALVYAHAQSVLHCNLEPDNVLIDEGTKAYLIDFDPVRAEEVAGEGPRRGAHVYAAPEIDTPQHVDRRTDVYGLGMLALFMLHGKPLTRDVTRPELGFIDGLSAPAPIRTALKKATAWRPEDRYPDVQAFIDDLVKADAPSPTPAQPPALPPTPKPAPIPEPAPTLKPDGITAPPSGWKSGLAWVVGGGALVSVLLVLAYVIESQPTGVPPVIETVGPSGSTGPIAPVTAASTGPVLDATHSSGTDERGSTADGTTTGPPPPPPPPPPPSDGRSRELNIRKLLKAASTACTGRNLDAHEPKADFKVSYTLDGASGMISLRPGAFASLYPRTYQCLVTELRAKEEDFPRFRGTAKGTWSVIFP
jgi:serine/threonine protein kinase